MRRGREDLVRRIDERVERMLAAGFEVFVVADAVSSRRPLDRQIAFELLRQSGAVVTTAESVIFEWLQDAADPKFKDVLKLVRDI